MLLVKCINHLLEKNIHTYTFRKKLSLVCQKEQVLDIPICYKYIVIY